MNVFLRTAKNHRLFFSCGVNRTRMAANVVCTPEPVLPNFLQSNRDGDYMTWVSGLLSARRGKTIKLKKPACATLTIGDVDDTIYSEEYDEVDEWGKFYLPEEVRMQVVGVVEGTSCPCDQLVLMTCKDMNIYGYDGEELHMVASDMDQLFKEGIEYPASKRYYNGEAFKNMTDKDWDKMRKGPVGKSLDEAHRKLVTSKKSNFLANLAGASR